MKNFSPSIKPATLSEALSGWGIIPRIFPCSFIIPAILFFEPLGTNPFINFYRYLTPSSRSKDEHPLLKEDFENIEMRLRIKPCKIVTF